MGREDRILVVEDNPAITRAIEEKYDCDCATDGWDAISKLETSAYAAIVIDADVPRHSGYGVLTWIREEVGEDMDHVILMTTSSDRDGIRRRVGGGLHVVAKADAMDEIEKVLSAAC